MFEGIVREHLQAAGIEVGGDRPWDLQIHDDRFYRRVLLFGSLGLGDSYVDGWWDCDDLEGLVTRLLRHRLEHRAGLRLASVVSGLAGLAVNLQSRARAKIVAREHYDLPAGFYMSFLDPYNQYTCAWFEGTDDLEEAQEAKLRLICRKLELEEDDHVLDIGCGWGGFAHFASERIGCRVTGVTISEEQAAYARELNEGLPVEIVERDYRDLEGEYDKVLVCGMIEHVGYKNYRKLFQVARRCLEPGGLFLLHTIGGNESVRSIDPWIHRHIFPNAQLPSISQLGEASEGLMVMEDWHNFGPHYAPTLRAWFRRFDRAWPRLSEDYDETTYRTWKYYFLSCAASFEVRKNQLWQIVFSPEGVPGGYVAPRSATAETETTPVSSPGRTPEEIPQPARSSFSRSS
ncbi:MAG: cyclopropane fatty acyl phospholipid synthase [Thermoanaerobaculia bacterium]|nr:cyclopropane fatty acyl phospholipid synthase [Thermoanaerobaculia bacterium]